MRNSSWRIVVIFCTAAVLVIAGEGRFSPASEAGESALLRAVAIVLSEDKAVSVRPITEDSFRMEARSQGLVVWNAEEMECWQFVGPGQEWRLPDIGESNAEAKALNGSSRSANDGTGMTVDFAALTHSLEQIRGQTVLRDAGFLTPHDRGFLLGPKLTIRRIGKEKDKPLPKALALLYRGQEVLARIPFTEGQTKVEWDAIPQLPPALKAGLSPGQYTLRMEDGVESTTFTIVEEAEERAEVWKRPNDLAALLGGRTDPVYLQATAEHFLSQQASAERRSYPADALDVLESIPEKELTPHLQRLRQHVLRQLEDPAYRLSPPASAALGAPTGVPEIDRCRDFIAAGRWIDALEALTAIKPGSGRAEALAHLYRGVIFAESGPSKEEEAEEAFMQAIEKLQQGSAADLYRAHNDFGNFLLHRTQDRLYNHAFQMVTGGKLPMTLALFHWMEARDHYEAALQLADKLGPDAKAVVRINQARLFALLADIVRTLDVAPDGKRRFLAGEEAAARAAREQAGRVKDAGGVEPLLSGVAAEIEAHLAFRQQDPRGPDFARQAQKNYEQAGSLAGVESVQRLLGLFHLRAAQAGDGPARIQARKEALRHFLIAHQLAELLREQVPLERVGLSRAGFFSRRAYVNDKIIELLVAEGKDAQALRYAELAKARALQDLLAAQQSRAVKNAPRPRDLSELLSHWPKQVAALEYYLGSERAWVFLVNTGGEVRAFPIINAQGRPISSQQLAAEVHRFLQGMGFQAAKMRQRLLNGQGFDQSWQNDLHTFYRQLMPDPILARLREAETVVIVPHHILHYFPFAALVTERDAGKREPAEMVQPKFVIDEPFHLCLAPSLATWDLFRQRKPRPIAKVNGVGVVEVPGAPPLAGVETDLRNLKTIFENQIGTIRDNQEATPNNVKALLRQPGLLLLAAHGVNYADQPLQSRLLLHPDADSEDGSLTAAAIFETPVHADLIVMNACYSGLADRSPLPGDDLFGLQRALLHSGARTVVSGLWDVYDLTAPDLIASFFQEMKAGNSSASALAKAQRKFLNANRKSSDSAFFCHPYFWAVFTVAGDDRTR